MSKLKIGIDIGGTKTRIALIHNLDIIKEETFKTMPHLGGNNLLNRISTEIKKIIKDHTITNIGIGSAGQISKDGVVLDATNTFKDWVGQDIKSFFQDQFQVPVTVINDVQAMALGEIAYKNTINHNTIICIALGTGVGGALIINDKLHRGTRGTCGEFGHATLHPNGLICPCGNQGCAEAYLSGTAIEQSYFSLNKIKKSASEILISDEPESLTTVNQFIDNLCIYLTSITNMLSPDLIILSGGVSQSLNKHIEDINKRVQNKVLGSNKNIKLTISNLSSDAMVIGSIQEVY